MSGLPPWLLRWLLPVWLAGHLAIWVGLFNRLHALNIPDETIRRLERFTIFPAAIGLLPALIVAAWRGPELSRTSQALFTAYGALSVAALAIAATVWCWRAWQRPSDEQPLASNHTLVRDWRADQDRLVAPGRMQHVARIPGNQILTPHVCHKRLLLPTLPQELEGLTIAQLSDWHWTGKFTADFYGRLVDESNQWHPDVVVVTGDVVDKREYMLEACDVLSCLEARLGRYFILGNHDLRVKDEQGLRQSLEAAGLVDLGSRCLSLEWNQTPVFLAGDERPWFGPGPPLEDWPAGAFRILLAHTPDRFPWAHSQAFDLVLAGHTHGGQIRLPGIGPIVCPSAYGVRYASGVFRRGTTVMHVTRGLCGVHPLRFGCPPELSVLTLERA